MEVKEESEKAGLKLNIHWLKTQHSKKEDHGIWSHLHGKQMGKQWKQWQTLFSWVPKLMQMMTTAMKLEGPCSLEEKLWAT